MEKSPKTYRQALPNSREELLDLFKRAVELPNVEEILVTPTEFVMQRVVEDNEPVMPKQGFDDDLDPEFVLSREQMDLDHMPFDPEAHPYLVLERACRRITSKGLRPTHILAPQGEWLAAYFALPAEPPPQTIFGMKVVYGIGDNFSDKLVVIGGPSSYLSDATYGAIIDMGS